MVTDPGPRAAIPVVPALAAAALAEAAALAAAMPMRVKSIDFANDKYVTCFIVAALLAALVDGVLVLGWAWRLGRPSAAVLFSRACIAVLSLPLAIMAGVAMVVLPLLLARVVAVVFPFGLRWAGGYVAGLVIGAPAFATGGSVTGGMAAIGQAVDAGLDDAPVPGARLRIHGIGALLGLGKILIVLRAAAAFQRHQGEASPWLFAVLPHGLALGRLPHNALVLRDMAHAGIALPTARIVCIRSAFTAGLPLLAAAAVVVTNL